MPHHGLLLLFTFLWGANFILAEVALGEMSPISFSSARFAMGGLALFVVLWYQFRSDSRVNGGPVPFLPRLDRSDWPRMILISVLGATLAPWLGIEGLGLTHGARASLWLALGPALSTGFGFLLSTEQMSRYGFFGVALAILGTVILAFDGLQPEQGYWIGDLILIAALAMTVVELHLIKPLARRYGSVPVVALRTAIGGSLYLLIAAPSLADQPWLSLGLWTWIAILAGGAVGVGIGQWVKVRALRKLGPTQVVLYGNMVPIAAIFIAWVSIGEDPSVLELVSGLLIVTGAIFIQIIDARTRSKRGRTPADHEEETYNVISGSGGE